MRTVAYILFGSGFTVCACTGLGTLILQWLKLRDFLSKSEFRLFAFLAGSAALSFLMFGLCATHLVYKGVLLVIGVVVIVAATRTVRFGDWRFPEVGWSLQAVFWLPVGVYGTLYFFNALAPEVSPDGSAYHLAFVTRYQHWRGFQPITTNMYANMPQAMEMLFLFAFVFGRHSAAALVHLSFLFVLALQLRDYGRRRQVVWAGMFAGAIVFASPIFGIDGVSAYNDVALAAAAFGCFYAIETWRDCSNPRVLILAGLLAGFSYALKQTGAFVIVYLIAAILVNRGRRIRLMELSAGLFPAVLVAGVWIVRSYAVTGNPVSPLFNSLFPNPYVHVSFEEAYSRDMRASGLIGSFPLSLVWDGAAGGTFGPAFLLVPLGLLALTRPLGRRLVSAALVFSLPYFLNTGARFLMPAAPLLALAVGHRFTWRSVLVVAVAGQSVFAWPSVLERLRAPTCWNIREFPVLAALRIEPEESYIRRRLPHYDMARFIEKVVPSGARVLALEPVEEAYTTRTIVVSYESAEGERERDILLTPLMPSLQPDGVVTFQFPGQSLQGFRLTGKKSPAVVNEVSASYQGKLLNASHWSSSCEPFRWDCAFATDGNTLTKWSSWQSKPSDSLLDFRFPSTTHVDRIVVAVPHRALSTGSLQVRLLTPKGGVAEGVPSFVSQPTLPDLRASATLTLKSEGTEFLMVPNQSYWASEFFKHQEAWRLQLLGEWGNSRLYRFE